jgi:hypothetical protein
MYRHGLYTRQALEERRFLRDLLLQSRHRSRTSKASALLSLRPALIAEVHSFIDANKVVGIAVVQTLLVLIVG